jgi:hypothetical protein
VDIMDAPCLLEWLGKSEEDQLLVELRHHEGYWQHRITGLHRDVEIVTSLDPASCSAYHGVYWADWYYEGVPLAFSSAEDYENFCFDNHEVSMVQEAVLFWKDGAPRIENPWTFKPR